MYKVVVKGDKWGTLTCIFAGFQYEAWEDKDRSGGAGTHKVYVYELACECGKTVVVHRADFPGKQKMPDCGCGKGAYGKSVTVTFTIPGGLQQKMAGIAVKEHNGLSATAARMMRWGVERWEIEQQEEEARQAEIEAKKPPKFDESFNPFEWRGK